ncbi:MAG: hypothetical protein H0V76_10905 [Blastocatellia bacterium]|nr:hypothetical protein [Blastocatellia bacterium]
MRSQALNPGNIETKRVNALRALFHASLFAAFIFLINLSWAAGQTPNANFQSQEISEVDGIPVLIKNLPDWQAVQSSTIITNSVEGVRAAIGDRPVLANVEFIPGTEAVTATYPAGQLLIIEYTSPQTATEANFHFALALADNPSDPPIIFRRIGNYLTFVFDAPDAAAANALLDQIRYGKYVQWLGEDPYLLQKFERYFAMTSRDVALSTVLWILLCAALAIGVGVATGVIFYRHRERERLTRTRFSDAGGLTRLNLDDLTEPIVPE